MVGVGHYTLAKAHRTCNTESTPNSRTLGNDDVSGTSAVTKELTEGMNHRGRQGGGGAELKDYFLNSALPVQFL